MQLEPNSSVKARRVFLHWTICPTGQIALIAPMLSDDSDDSDTSLSKKSAISAVDISESPPRKRQILRNFHFILPKFHFILPNFYFAPPWGNFVSSLTLSYFLPRKETNSKMYGRTRRVTPCRDARSVRPSPNHLTCNSLSLIQRIP